MSEQISMKQVDEFMDELRKECNREQGGYSSDKQSAYYNGYMDGIDKIVSRLVNSDPQLLDMLIKNYQGR